MTSRHIRAAPADETEAAMIYLDNDYTNCNSRFTKTEVPYASYTTPSD